MSLSTSVLSLRGSHPPEAGSFCNFLYKFLKFSLSKKTGVVYNSNDIVKFLHRAFFFERGGKDGFV
jgi:hypothetical protein